MTESLKKVFDIRSDAKVFMLFALAAICIYLPLLLWNRWPEADVAARYAPMAEAFARGDFQYAFHPRCQMLHPTVAGVFVALFGVSGFTGCKLSALLFFILGAIPLFYLTKQIFGRKKALLSLLFYLLCFQVIDRLVVEGVRDSAKMFIQLAMAAMTIRIFFDRDSLKNYLALGFFCGLGICIRGEMVFIAVCILLTAVVLESIPHKYIFRSLAGALCAVAVGSLEIGLNYGFARCAAPNHNLFLFFIKIFNAAPTLPMLYAGIFLPGLALLFLTGFILHAVLASNGHKKAAEYGLTALVLGAIVYAPIHVHCDLVSGIGFLERIFRVLSPPFCIPAVIGIAVEVKKRRWTPARTLLIVIFGIYTLLLLGQIIYHDRYFYVSTRYLLPSIPLFLPWSVTGVLFLWAFLSGRLAFLRHKGIAVVCAGVFLGIYYPYRAEINRHFREKEQKRWASIEAIRRELSKEKKEIRAGDLSLFAYRSDIHPQVFFAEGMPSPLICSAYLAGCAVADHPETADLLIGTSGQEDKMPCGEKNIRLLKYKTVTDKNGVVFFIWKVEKI